MSGAARFSDTIFYSTVQNSVHERSSLVPTFESLSNQRLLRARIQYDLPVCDDCMQQLTVRFSSWEKLFYRFFFCFFPFLSTNTRIHVGDLPVLCRLNFYRLSIFSVTSSIFEVLSPSRILVHAFSPNFENSQSPLFLPDAVMISRDSTHTSKI